MDGKTLVITRKSETTLLTPLQFQCISYHKQIHTPFKLWIHNAHFSSANLATTQYANILVQNRMPLP